MRSEVAMTRSVRYHVEVTTESEALANEIDDALTVFGREDSDYDGSTWAHNGFHGVSAGGTTNIAGWYRVKTFGNEIAECIQEAVSDSEIRPLPKVSVHISLWDEDRDPDVSAEYEIVDGTLTSDEASEEEAS
jgi:hypothetical protein